MATPTEANAVRAEKPRLRSSAALLGWASVIAWSRKRQVKLFATRPWPGVRQTRPRAIATSGESTPRRARRRRGCDDSPGGFLELAAEPDHGGVDHEIGQREEVERVEEDEAGGAEKRIAEPRRQQAELREIAVRRHQQHPGERLEIARRQEYQPWRRGEETAEGHAGPPQHERGKPAEQRPGPPGSGGEEQ